MDEGVAGAEAASSRCGIIARVLSSAVRLAGSKPDRALKKAPLIPREVLAPLKNLTSAVPRLNYSSFMRLAGSSNSLQSKTHMPSPSCSIRQQLSQEVNGAVERVYQAKSRLVERSKSTPLAELLAEVRAERKAVAALDEHRKEHGC